MADSVPAGGVRADAVRADAVRSDGVPADEAADLPTPLSRAFYARDPRVVAPELLGKVLVRTGTDGAVRAVRIVETEAYCGADDPGSHAFRGMTPRNATMFGPPGGLYVYFTYGMHWCANAVCGAEGEGVAVLLRAAAPLRGLATMFAARPRARRERDLCSGPAKLCQALGVDGALDGASLVDGPEGVWLGDDGVPPPARPVQTTRIGLSAGSDHPWRWCVPGDRNVSGPARLRTHAGTRRDTGGGRAAAS